MARAIVFFQLPGERSPTSDQRNPRNLRENQPIRINGIVKDKGTRMRLNWSAAMSAITIANSGAIKTRLFTSLFRKSIRNFLLSFALILGVIQQDVEELFSPIFQSTQEKLLSLSCLISNNNLLSPIFLTRNPILDHPVPTNP